MASVPWDTMQGTLGVGGFPGAEDSAGLSTACIPCQGGDGEEEVHFFSPLRHSSYPAAHPRWLS